MKAFQRWRWMFVTLLIASSLLALFLWRNGYGLRGGAELIRLPNPPLLVLPVVVLFATFHRRNQMPGGLGTTRATAAWLFGALAAFCAAFAAIEPEWGHPIDRLTVVFAVDRSRSMELVPGAAQRARDEEVRGAEAMREHDRLARVVFAATAATEDPAHAATVQPSAQEVVVGLDATDIASAIRRALAEIPSESAGRVLLFSDGASNRGDALAAAASAGAAGVPVDVFRVTPRYRQNLRVEAARAPGSVDQGEAFDLRVVTRSDVSGEVEVRILVDGRLRQTGRARVQSGEDVLHLRQVAPEPGLHRYEVDVTSLDRSIDAHVQDNRGGTFVRVRGPSSVLILEGDPGRAGPLAGALRAAAFRVDEVSPSAFPEDLASLSAYDLVVLSDVPARQLAPSQMEQLAPYVRELGGGLLLMGGDRSMGPGGYSRTPVEEVSPVSFDLRQERRRASLAQVIAIDFSGSMAATVPTGQTKLQLANEASARSAALLGATDRLGVMHVDTMVHWTIPLGLVGDARNISNIQSRIRAVGPSGGGIIIPVTLEASYAALQQQNANLRHLLLFADGSDAENMQGQAAVVAQAFTRGITTSVVSLGRGNDTPGLEELSRMGHGRFYLVEDATRLPAVFAQETVLASRSSIREEPFRPVVNAPDVVTRGIDFAAGPALRGWVVTIPKPRASILLTGPDNDPILATWQVGVGRVGAFTSDAKDRWGAPWLTWAEAPRLWAELARSLARRSDPLVRVEADTHGGVLHVNAEARTADGYADPLRRLTVRVTTPDLRSRELPLDPVGAGTYAAEYPLDRPGAVAIAVRDEGLRGVVVATGGALLNEGEELRPPGDPQLLERVLALTGGRTRTNLADAFRDRVGLRRAYTPLAPALMQLSVFFLLLSLAARRLATPEFLQALLTRRVRAPEPEASTATMQALLARKQRVGRVSAPPPSPEQPATTYFDPGPPSGALEESKPEASTGEVSTSAPKKPASTVDALLAKKRLRK